MASPTLKFDKLEIRRFLGVTGPGSFSMPEAEFSPGLNLIYGPNASGKTTMALALQSLLWPAATEDRAANLQADCTLGGERLRIVLDAEQAAYISDGVKVNAPELPSPQHKSR